MRKSELIARLNTIEGDPEVCLVDLSNDQEGEGIASKYSVELLENDNEESPAKEFIGIQYNAK